MKTYRAMLAEIERLQRKAEILRRAELKGVIKHIRELISKHGLTGSDLGLDGTKATSAPRQFQDLLAAVPSRGRKAGKAPKASVAKGVARYQDPATGKTWTGRGKPPNWIAGAKDRAAFEIGAVAAEPSVKKVRVARAAKKPVAKKAAVKRGAGKRATPAKATKAGKAPKAVKLPKPPTPKVTQGARKKAKAARSAPADSSNGATPVPGAE